MIEDRKKPGTGISDTANFMPLFCNRIYEDGYFASK